MTTPPAAPKAPTVKYSSCADVKKAGAAPLYKGDPGYSTSLDRDEDGVACEK
ncbi:excalibur calcium-binding domain-containing protein [Rhodococcus qingshengii]|uniref:excalibur calcium-binding domain-containing protein n=1 Tax=Rhodococcus qingshengii TaxID=334542 RepID=UPI00211DF29A|nr:excalibur calcium-binding domain-containing protein [Rhodococcus qingshengii]